MVNASPENQIPELHISFIPFNELLDLYIRELGFTQTEVAQTSGVHSSSVSRYLGGKSFPTRPNAENLAVSFNLTSQERVQLMLSAGVANSRDFLPFDGALLNVSTDILLPPDTMPSVGKQIDGVISTLALPEDTKKRLEAGVLSLVLNLADLYRNLPPTNTQHRDSSR